MKNKCFSIINLFIVFMLVMAMAVGCSNETTTSQNNTSANENTEVNNQNDASDNKNIQVSEIKTMTGKELVKQNSGKEKDKVLIIDVRSPEEYKAGHIPNAININIDEFEQRLSEIEDLKDFPIIVYCNSGKKSGQAAEILVNNGFKDVTNAEGVKQFEYELVHYTDLRGAAFEKFITENSDIVLVDVREESQVKEEGMIEGAINVPYNAVEANLDKLPKDKTIALYCNTGTKSVEVAKQLEALGYENVINSIDGVKEYSFKLVK